MRRHAWLYLRPWKRHSLVLAVAAVVYLAIGVVYVTVPLTDERAGALAFALQLAPIETWGAVWIVVGLLAFASTRWPPASETWGYTVMSALAALWAAFYGLGVVLFGAPASGWSGVLVWGLVAFMWWGISGLRNPDDVPLGSGEEGR